MHQQSKLEIEECARQNDSHGIRQRLDGLEPTEIGAVLEMLPQEDAIIAFRALPRPSAAAVFGHLRQDSQAALAEGLSSEDGQLASLLNDLSPDDRTAFFASLPDATVQRFLSMLGPEKREDAIRLLGYPEDSVGRLATTDYISLRSDWTIEQALQHIRRVGRDSETINVIYIVDQKGKLQDELRLRELLLAEPETQVASLMDNRFVALTATDDQEKAVQSFRENERVSLPVVAPDGELSGIVTVDDVLSVAEEEATEDIQKLGGLESLDLPYMNTPLATLIRKRASWLAVLFVGELFTATAMGYFESQIEKAVVLSLFLPLILSSGGNSGSQATSLMIRALATGEVHVRDWWRVMRREVLAGLALGGILGLMGLLRITVWATAFGSYGQHWMLIGLTIGLALVGVVLWGSLAGAMLPFIMKRLGADPATSSAPFVATLVDVTGLVIYFSVAIAILSGTVL